MRVALLSYEYPPDTGFGGIGTYTWYQARALARLGHEVHVIAGSTEPGVRRTDHEGVQVTRVAGLDFLVGAGDGLRARGLPWAANRLETAQSAFVALRDLLEREPVDLVEFPECGADGLFASTVLELSTCVRLHSPARLIMETYGADARDIEATAILEQVAIRQADLRIAPSRYLARTAETLLDAAPPVHVVPNGLDLDLVDRDEGIDVVDRFGLPTTPDALLLFSSGRLERRKGIHVLIDACLPLLARDARLHLVLAGADGEQVVPTSLRPRAEALGVADRVHLLGRVGLREIRALLRHVDVHLHPSLWDNAPYSCLEAMAAGRPLVASDCGGLPELVDDGVTGLLAPTGDPEAFGAAVARLIEDAGLRDRLGTAARRAVEERFTDDAMARRSVELWQATIAGHG